MYRVADISWLEEKVDVYDGLPELGNYHPIDFIDVDMMQFIGLKDKNNHEIYQGDIIKSFGQFIHEVVKHNGAFGYVPDKYTGFISLAQNYHFEWTTKSKSNKIEVVGNIYENPELLKKDA